MEDKPPKRDHDRSDLGLHPSTKAFLKLAGLVGVATVSSFLAYKGWKWYSSLPSRKPSGGPSDTKRRSIPKFRDSKRQNAPAHSPPEAEERDTQFDYSSEEDFDRASSRNEFDSEFESDNGYIEEEDLRQEELAQAARTQFDKSAEDVENVSAETLQKILKLVEDTANGRRLQLSQDMSVEEFKRVTPLTSYKDYVKSIKRMLNGRANVMVPDSQPIVQFTYSDWGGGEMKTVPHVLHQARVLTLARLAADYDLIINRPKARSGPVAALYSGCRSKKKTADGKYSIVPLAAHIGEAIGQLTSRSDVLVTKRKQRWDIHDLNDDQDDHVDGIPQNPKVLELRALPESFSFHPDVCRDVHPLDCAYVHAVFACACADLTEIRAPFIYTLDNFFHLLQEEWASLVASVRSGVFDRTKCTHTDSRVISHLDVALTPNKERADHLETVFETTFSTNPSGDHKQRDDLQCGKDVAEQIWPNLVLCQAPRNGELEEELNKVRHFLGQVPLYSPILNSVEGLLGINIDFSKPNEFVPVPQYGFFELLPLDSNDVSSFTSFVYSRANSPCGTPSRTPILSPWAGSSFNGLPSPKALSLDGGSNTNSNIGFGSLREPQTINYTSDSVDLSDAVIGESYELIISTFNGLLRCKTGKIVRVVNRYRQLPVFEVQETLASLVRLPSDVSLNPGLIRLAIDTVLDQIPFFKEHQLQATQLHARGVGFTAVSAIKSTFNLAPGSSSSAKNVPQAKQESSSSMTSSDVVAPRLVIYMALDSSDETSSSDGDEKWQLQRDWRHFSEQVDLLLCEGNEDYARARNDNTLLTCSVRLISNQACHQANLARQQAAGCTDLPPLNFALPISPVEFQLSNNSKSHSTRTLRSSSSSSFADCPRLINQPEQKTNNNENKNNKKHICTSNAVTELMENAIVPNTRHVALAAEDDEADEWIAEQEERFVAAKQRRKRNRKSY